MQAITESPAREFQLARSNPALRPAKLAVAIGFGMLVVSTIGMLREVEPFATWYYIFSWYSVLLAADGVLALRGAAGRGVKGEFLLLGRRWFLVSMLFWSTVVWLFYELLNFRLQNWYYVFLPDQTALRWLGTAIAFATVLPAVFVAEAALRAVRFAEHTRWKPLPVSARMLTRMQIIGAAMMVLVLAFPRYFFPLVWGASMMMAEPAVYRRSRQRSILGDLEQGRPGRLLRLLAGGALIGLLWELLNIGARAKWIYTVPFFEEARFFEMPLPGFLGFPPFAVECFILWQGVVCLGLAVPRLGQRYPASTRRLAAGGLAAVLFCVITLAGMDLLTFTSMKPKLNELNNVPAPALERAGYDVFRLARSEPGLVAADVGTDRLVAQRWIATAQLATLRGIGATQLNLLNQVGISTIEELANTPPGDLVHRLERLTGQNWVDARVRVWVRGARRALQAS